MLANNRCSPESKCSQSTPKVLVKLILIEIMSKENESLTCMAEWVSELDWRLGGPEFETRRGNFASELWQFRLPRFASVFRSKH